MATSVAQEFYKVREEWAKADCQKSWRLAIWVAEFQDVDIIDKFMETERLPIGVFDDLFFRFDAEYKEDDASFDEALWQEYVSWFERPQLEQYDIYTALKNEGLLRQEYKPDTSLSPTIINLWKEMLRFKSCIEGLETTNFLVYLPPTRPDGPAMGGWFTKVLELGIPRGIRLATVDFAKQRKVKISFRKIVSAQVAELSVKLNMSEAISNEMDKGDGSYDTVSPDARYRKQVRVVMETTLKKSTPLLEKEVGQLLVVGKELSNASAGIGALLVASQAWFAVKDYDRSWNYTEEAAILAAKEMETDERTGYPTWKVCMMMKAAILCAIYKRKEAIAIYEELADVAISKADSFHLMECHRLAGHLYYEEGKYNTAFETLLLSLAAGSHLKEEVRRQSTFVQAAHLALYIAPSVRNSADMAILENHLQLWLGSDWRDLVSADEMKKSTTKRKKPLFS